VRDVSAQSDKYYIDVNGVKQFKNDVALTCKPPKPVDEDLYKIPPEFIHSSTRVRAPSHTQLILLHFITKFYIFLINFSILYHFFFNFVCYLKRVLK